MNTHIKPIVFSISLALTGCAGIGQKSRIGENDGSNPCYIHLKAVDDIAVYYNDDQMKTVAGGAFIGLLAGAATGAVVSKGNTTATVAGGVIGAAAGGFLANAYWDNKMQQAHNAKSQAIAMVEKDLQEDVDRMNNLDQNVRDLVHCRMKQRDRIRRDYAERRITREQAQAQWMQWGEQMKKDLEEMTYLSDALNNMEKMEQSYQYALNATAPGDAAENYDSKATYDDAETSAIADEKMPRRQKTASEKHKPQTAQGKSNKPKGNKPQKASNKNNQKKPSQKPASRMGGLVAARHEKFESVKKGKDQMANMAAEGANKNGFEQISLLRQDPAPLAALSNPTDAVTCSIPRAPSVARSNESTRTRDSI